IDKAFDEVKRVEDVYSVYNHASEISRINKLRKNEKLQISDGVFNLILKSIDYSKRTFGTFDITVKPIIDLWHKAKTRGRVPSEDEISRALGHVGYKNIVLDETNRTISFKKEEMSIDMGGIAKGYATDRAINILEDAGINNALVTSGGDMYCLGKKSRTELWKVGIRHPRNKDKLFLEMSLKDRAISTSGDYERYFILDGKRYSHIIDPRTGYPIGDNIVSASVITSDSTTSDILATSMCILGEKGFYAIKEFGDIDAVLVMQESGHLIVRMSEGIKKRYDISQEKL
ncbi:MAG: FAD:protein FMN transferase, partial [Candidatus Omnitrophota bacterium]